MGTTRIMVVEDEQIIAMNIAAKLENMGYEVPAMLATGEDAVREAAQILPDLVLMDINLAGEMDGIEAAAQWYKNLPASRKSWRAAPLLSSNLIHNPA